MPPSCGIAYDILWIFNQFNSRKLLLEPHTLFMAASKISRNIQVLVEKPNFWKIALIIQLIFFRLFWKNLTLLCGTTFFFEDALTSAVDIK